jgi:hypothetical protein
MRTPNVARVGGAALIVGALGFAAVFAYLAARFDYPAVLDGSAADVLPRLLATGDAGRRAWALYAFLPLIWIPAGVGAFHALRHVHEGAMRAAMLFAALSAIAMILGLARWPSIHWELAQTYVTSGAGEKAVLASVFAGLNTYLGNYVGEFLGELSFSVFFLLSARAMLDARSGFPRWLGTFGLLTGFLGLVGMLRNVTGAVGVVAEIDNYLLPAWMIAFGIGLLRARDHDRLGLLRPLVLAGPGAGAPVEPAVPASSPV